MDVHRHHQSFEIEVFFRRKIRWILYDDFGSEMERMVLDADGDLRMLNVEGDRWHSLECIESGSMLYVSKDGPYHPLEGDEIFTKLDEKGVECCVAILLISVLASETAKGLLMVLCTYLIR